MLSLVSNPRLPTRPGRPARSLSRLAPICPALLLILALASPARAEVAVSNLTNTSFGSFTVNPTQLGAGAFTTGTTASRLANISLALSASDGASSMFTVALYSSNFGVPGLSIETLTGPTGPQSAGNYSFTSGGATTLNSSTTYLGVGSLAGSGTDSRQPRVTSDTNNASSVGWTIGDNFYVQSGGNWNLYDEAPMSSAASVPEPASYAALAGMAALGLAAWRRRRAA